MSRSAIAVTMQYKLDRAGVYDVGPDRAGF